MVVTSPPYNVGLDYSDHNDAMKYEDYLEWMRNISIEIFRVLVDGGRFALNIAPTSIADFCPVHHDLCTMLRNLGFIMRTEIIWYKQTMRSRTAWGSWKSPNNPHIIPSWEYVFVFSKKQWNLPGDPTDIDITTEEFKRFSDGHWFIRPETRKRQPYLKGRKSGTHPAAFPEELVYRLLKYYSYRNNVILDMFGGTGTVAAVALKTNRQFIHFDNSVDYNEIAKKRISAINIEVESRHMTLFPADSLA